MAYASLAEFLEELSDRGQLARVAAEVDPLAEVAEITRRVAAQRGPAILFERVGGPSLALVTNLLGSDERVCRALAIESLDDIATRVDALVEQHTPRNWFERLKSSGDESGANKFRPRTVKAGPCQQVVRLGRDVDLAALPLVKQWPAETRPAITGGLLITAGRATADQGAGQRAATACPLAMLDQNRLAVIDDGTSDFARHWSDYRQAGQQMPVAVVVGGDPAGAIAAAMGRPPGADIVHLIGLLRAQAVDTVKCRTHALEVPAEADMILEGYLDPKVPETAITAAPAGSSHYWADRHAPVFHVSAITHRTHPIVPAAIDTGEQGQAGALLKVRERMLLPAIRTLAPGVVDLHFPNFGTQGHWAFVSLAKTHPHQARQVASALWGSAALRSTRYLILVDAELDVRDVRGVLCEVGAHAVPERDMFSYDGPAGGMAITCADNGEAASVLARHVGIDATTKIAGEHSGPARQRLTGSPEVAALVAARWAEYGLDLDGAR